jgi:hypothetical protein
LRCALFGHDWRRAIAPREGYYFRCRRCWVSRFDEPSKAEAAESTWRGSAQPSA